MTMAVVAATLEPATAPARRPLRGEADDVLAQRFERALRARDGYAGAHCVHEQWMRGALEANIERALVRLWERAAESIPDWLPMRHIDWLPLAYEVAGRFRRGTGGHSHVYLVLLDYRDSRDEPYGVYVGMSRYLPAQRFDQHKAGIRAAGSVLRRGLEVLTGPVLHLRHLARAEAAGIEENLAAALRAAGIFVQGGH